MRLSVGHLHQRRGQLLVFRGLERKPTVILSIHHVTLRMNQSVQVRLFPQSSHRLTPRWHQPHRHHHSTLVHHSRRVLLDVTTFQHSRQLCCPCLLSRPTVHPTYRCTTSHPLHKVAVHQCLTTGHLWPGVSHSLRQLPERFGRYKRLTVTPQALPQRLPFRLQSLPFRGRTVHHRRLNTLLLLTRQQFRQTRQPVQVGLHPMHTLRVTRNTLCPQCRQTLGHHHWRHSDLVHHQ